MGGLKDLEIESIDKGFNDMMTVGIAVDGLGAIGVETVKNRPDDWSMIVLKVIDSMESVGVKAVEKGFGYPIMDFMNNDSLVGGCEVNNMIETVIPQVYSASPFVIG